jgi:CheY-like chemotaxis protein
MSTSNQPQPVAQPEKRETLMVVDDEPSVREVLARVLEEEGYRVLTAASGPEALQIAAANPIDLVLLDLNMPQQNGWDTFERLTARNPLLAVIIVTARPGQLFTALGAGVSALLEKPLDYPNLVMTVRSVLAEPPQVRIARMTGQPADFRYQAPGRKPS